ncbi:Putative type IV pilin protein [Collimonas arenae]|uniref:Putative type IV pilin protein n=1 Tax=Collimonas arenae TaxID=279058 RepID=A0A0A1F4J6_9BURK|nr:type 4 pilus major pilin [Collimonas arenae]AIY39643.1 Putative type IV pilin protein [Collimonas arenae]
MKNSRFMQSGKSSIINRQRGASLLEGIAYLGIAAIVILGAVSLLMGAFSSAQTNRASEEVVSIRTGVKKLYMGQSAAYSTGSLNPQLITAKVFPTTLAVTEAGGVTNTWNGAVTVTGVNANFTISYTAVPQDVCINMISGSNGWVSVAVNDGAENTAFPITPKAATDACTSTAGNKIVWTAL